MLAVEAVHVQVDHLQEAGRDKFRREEFPQASEDLLLHACFTVQWFQLYSLRQLRPAKKVFVAVRHCPQLLIWAEILDVRLHQWRVLAKQLHLCPLLRHDLVHHFAQDGWLLGCRG